MVKTSERVSRAREQETCGHNGCKGETSRIPNEIDGMGCMPVEKKIIFVQESNELE